MIHIILDSVPAALSLKSSAILWVLHRYRWRHEIVKNIFEINKYMSVAFWHSNNLFIGSKALQLICNSLYLDNRLKHFYRGFLNNVEVFLETERLGSVVAQGLWR